VAVDPVTFAAAARYVYGAFSALGGGQLSAADRRAIDASGTRPFRGVFRGAGGLVLSQSQAIARGNAVLSAARPLPTPPLVPTAPPPVYQTPEGLLGEIFERQPTFNPGQNRPVPGNPDFEDLLRRPDSTIGRGPLPSERGIPVARGAVPFLARAAGLLGGLLYPTPTADSDLGYKAPPPPRPPRPTRRPTRPGRRPPKPPLDVLADLLRDRPRPPFPQTPADSLPRPDLRPNPRTRQPAPDVGSNPIAPPRLLPQPQPQAVPTPTASPSTSTRPLPASRPLPVPRPSTIAWPYLLPILAALPRPSSRPANRNPLTDSPGLSRPGTSGDTLTQIRPAPRPLTAPLPQPLASPIGGSSDPCKCTRSSKPKRKRKPRSVCYRGSFTETRASTLKVRKEQIPCR